MNPTILERLDRATASQPRPLSRLRNPLAIAADGESPEGNGHPRRRLRTASALFAWLVLSLTLPGLLAVEDRIEKAFAIGAGGKLTIAADRGSIQIKPADTAEVRIEVIRKASNQELLDKHTVDFETQGNEVLVRGKTAEGIRWNWFGNRLEVRFIAQVPPQFNVSLRTAGGSIEIGDLQGEARAETSGGSLRFGRLLGPVWGKTSGGSIRLEACQQSVDVHTSGGSIDLGELNAPTKALTSGGSIHVRSARAPTEVRTSGGGIRLDDASARVLANTSGGSISASLTQAPKEDCSLSTSGGSIEVRLPESAAVDIDAKTSGGRVSTDLPVTVQGQIRHSSLRGKLNGGGPKLTLRTSGGGIRLGKN
jgi:hypothetical protein